MKPSFLPSWAHHLQTENIAPGSFSFLPPEQQSLAIEHFAETHPDAIIGTNPLSNVAKRKNIHAVLIAIEEYFSYIVIKEAEIRQLIKEIRAYRARHRYDDVDFSFDVSDDSEK